MFLDRPSLLRGLSGLMLACVVSAGVSAASERYDRARARLIDEIESDVRGTALYLGKEVLDPRVLQAVGQVPRHEFVPERQRRYAYENRPLPIGHGQTISQPYIVAIMTDLVGPQANHRVLEIGTSSANTAA